MVDVFDQSKADSIRKSQVQSDPMEKMGQSFRDAAMVPEGPASFWVNYGVMNGLTENTPAARDKYAYDLGRVYSFAKTDSGEKFSEDLNPSEIAEKMNITPVKAQQLISGLVGAQVIKSKKSIEMRKKAGR